MDAPSKTAVVILCGGMPDFAALSAARQRMQQQLEAVGALQAVIQSATQEACQQYGSSSSSLQNNGLPAGHGDPPGSLLAVRRLPAAAGGGAFGATSLLHFAYKLSMRQQYVMSPFSRALSAGGLQQVSGHPPVWLAVICLQPGEVLAR
jgi:hypothetical protein